MRYAKEASDITRCSAIGLLPQRASLATASVRSLGDNVTSILRIGRERASRHDDCQHQGGRGPAVRDKVNPGEVLIKVVNKDKPKMLSGLNQKVRGQVRGLRIPPSRMVHHRPIGTT